MTHIPTLLTVRQMAQKHPAFSEPALRWIIFNADATPDGRHRGNGFGAAILRRGRKVLIDEHAFFECLYEMNGRPAP